MGMHRMYSIDNPLVRSSAQCPMCHGPKQTGCVTCWECHNTTEYGTEAQREVREAAIEAAEDMLRDHDRVRQRAFGVPDAA